MRRIFAALLMLWFAGVSIFTNGCIFPAGAFGNSLYGYSLRQISDPDRYPLMYEQVAVLGSYAGWYVVNNIKDCFELCDGRGNVVRLTYSTAQTTNSFESNVDVNQKDMSYAVVNRKYLESEDGDIMQPQYYDEASGVTYRYVQGKIGEQVVLQSLSWQYKQFTYTLSRGLGPPYTNGVYFGELGHFASKSDRVYAQLIDLEKAPVAMDVIKRCLDYSGEAGMLGMLDECLQTAVLLLFTIVFPAGLWIAARVCARKRADDHYYDDIEDRNDCVFGLNKDSYANGSEYELCDLCRQTIANALSWSEP